MAQKPIAMEQLKQVLQLHNDGIAIREIARRVGIDRNTVRKYLSRLRTEENTSEGDLAEQAYDNDLLELEAERLRQITVHLANPGRSCQKQELPGSCYGRNTWSNTRMDTVTAGIVTTYSNI